MVGEGDGNLEVLLFNLKILGGGAYHLNRYSHWKHLFQQEWATSLVVFMCAYL
jgi:hypothetical protein